MSRELPRALSSTAQVVFATGSAAFTVLERLIILYMPFYFLPPEEYGLPNLIPDGTFLGLGTILGAALLAGRVVDAAANPLIATWSDNSRFKLGRRKPFLLLSSLPLTVATVLVFFPPHPGEETMLNGIWLILMMCLFYLFFAGYINPYLSLISELGHTDATRINLSTLIALFGILGMAVITILFPEVVSRLQEGGMGLRSSYRWTVTIIAALSAAALYLVTLSFNESRHCRPVNHRETGMWEALKYALSVRPFRLFIAGEAFLQFALNMVTLGMMYYTVVIFKQEQQFMSVLAVLTISSALAAFPLVNRISKKVGKIKVMLYGVIILIFCSLSIFLMSFNMESIFFYLGVALFGLAGIPLASMSILVNPTVAEIARAEAVKSGRHQEGIFFAARAVPLKITIALAGAVFGFLLSAFGKDIANPLGVQLSILVISLSSAAGFFFLRLYPEKEVQKALQHEAKEFQGKTE